MAFYIAQTVPTDQRSCILKLIESALWSKRELEDVVDQLCKNDEQARVFIESRDGLKQIRPLLANLIKSLSESKLYADQVVASKYAYLSGYRQARPIDEQIQILRKFDWGRSINWELSDIQKKLLTQELPFGSEGYFVVVFDRIMVTHYEDDPTVSQSGPVRRCLDMLIRQRQELAVKYDSRYFDQAHYHRSRKATLMMQELWASQGCPLDIMLIPAQLGLKYAGHSALRSGVVFQKNEFPLDAYEILIMTLTHENRLQHYDDLWMTLPGSEYSKDANGIFDHSLYIKYVGGAIHMGSIKSSAADGYYGSVSGFLFSQ